MKPRIWFTSDTHFDHKRIVELSDRPFWKDLQQTIPDTRAMNEALVAFWNERVSHDDTVYHLGDFGFGSTSRQEQWAGRLRGHKVLVLGNHDRLTKTAYRRMFERVEKEIRLGQLLLRHRPTDQYKAPEGCRYVLCGHVHESWAQRDACINVGVDVRNFRPVSLEDLGLDDWLLSDGRLRRNLSTPESRAYWESVEGTAAEVAKWPAWKKVW